MPGQRPESDDPAAIPLFQQARYTLNGLNLFAVSAAFARLAYALHKADCIERPYNNGPQAGFVSWIEHPQLGILAFRRADNLTLQFNW